MATSCCGVKKQKLNSAVVTSNKGNTSSMNYHNSANHCNGTVNMGSAVLSIVDNGHLPAGDRKRPYVINADMVVYCFDVLYSYLNNTDTPKAPNFANDHFPLFVTWKLGKEKKLRGCIGTFTSTGLHQGLREYAITSACKDSRFDPISVEEFARLHCSVSLLTDFEMADHYLDWEIGVHGIRIEFNNEKGSKKAATYLPEVAVEQGWTQIQTIDSLLRKGGFKGTISAEVRGSVCLVRFQSEKMTVSYQEYVAYKQRGKDGYTAAGLPSKVGMTNGDAYSNGIHDSGTSRHYHSNDNAPSSSMNGMMTNGIGGHHQSRSVANNVAGGGGGRRNSVNNRHRSNSSGGGESADRYGGLKGGQRNSNHYLPNQPYTPPNQF